MRLLIDTDARTLVEERGDSSRVLGLYTPEAFELLSEQWLKVGWDQKYAYTFTWLGRPIIQLPEDMLRAQEVIYRLQPDVIIETGIAHGGSLVYYASLCGAIGRGRVIGVDVEIRQHNREAIESHPLSELIALVEGDSVSPDTVEQVVAMVRPGESVMVFLDSLHKRQHVLQELEAYHDLVTPGSYIIATDGIMKDLADVPRGNPTWEWDNPAEAALEFARQHREFVLEQPQWPFNESELRRNVTHWLSAWLRRTK